MFVKVVYNLQLLQQFLETECMEAIKVFPEEQWEVLQHIQTLQTQLPPLLQIQRLLPIFHDDLDDRVQLLRQSQPQQIEYGEATKSQQVQ